MTKALGLLALVFFASDAFAGGKGLPAPTPSATPRPTVQPTPRPSAQPAPSPTVAPSPTDPVCRVTILHSNSQNLKHNDLIKRNLSDSFDLLSPACFNSYSSAGLQEALAQSCRANGGAMAEISLSWISSSGASSAGPKFSAYCQDLVPEKYLCSHFDTVGLNWVSTPCSNPSGS